MIKEKGKEICQRVLGTNKCDRMIDIFLCFGIINNMNKLFWEDEMTSLEKNTSRLLSC